MGGGANTGGMGNAGGKGEQGMGKGETGMGNAGGKGEKGMSNRWRRDHGPGRRARAAQASSRARAMAADLEEDLWFASIGR